MADDLTRPLGLDSDRRRRSLPSSPVGRAALGGFAAAVLLAAGLAWWLIPSASTPGIEVAANDRTGSIAGAAGAPPAGKGKPSGLTEIVTPEAGIRPLGKAQPAADADGSAIRLAALPRQDLIEKSRYGPLPRIGDDGTRPMDAYARPAGPVAGGLSRVAIVVGGLGVAEGSTASTLDKLPGAVTLAFAPYGDNIRAALERARADGHEILLQVPLEPYNYPAIDPGPHTLSSKAPAARNLDDLHWLLSRLTSYVGVVNYMGARFTADTGALAPVLAELGRRGLLYLDDGSSAQSRAAEAAADRVPFVQADVVLDADTTPEAIDQRLDQLAAIARQRGYAIGTGSAFPATVDRIDAFAAEAERRGIVLVPITAILSANRS